MSAVNEAINENSFHSRQVDHLTSSGRGTLAAHKVVGRILPTISHEVKDERLTRKVAPQASSATSLGTKYFPAPLPKLTELAAATAPKVTANPELESYLQEEQPELSKAFGRKVTNLDILSLCYALYALEVESQDLERRGRMSDRAEFILKSEQIKANFDEQGKWSLGSKVGSGILAILSGIAPIALQNQWLWGKVSGLSKSISDLGQTKFSMQAGKILFAMSELNKHTGEIHNTFADGRKSRAQYQAEIGKMDADEATRSLESVKRHIQDLCSMLLEMLQTESANMRSLYN